MIQAPITRQEAHEVPLNRIDAELANLWREADAVNLAAGGQPFARNSVMTLVVYTRNPDKAQQAARTIETLSGQHPSRSIIVCADPAAQGSPVSANVSIHSHAPNHGAGQVRAEQIFLTIRGDAALHVHSILLPLLLPEMPTFIWWVDALPEGDQAENLIELSDRSMIDSNTFADPILDLGRLASFIDEGSNPHLSRTAFSDFNWSRVHAWRELTAQFFDAPRFRPYLNGIEHIEIQYAAGNGRANPAQAFLYVAWLASRMRWHVYTSGRNQSGGTRIGLRSALGSPVTIDITTRTGMPTHDYWQEAAYEVDHVQDGQSATPTLSDGALLRVMLQSRVNGQPASFSIVREDDLKNATTVVVCDTETVPQRRAALESLGEASMLHQQLSVFDHNSVYESTMQAVREIVNSDTAQRNVRQK